jgi:hypothetical protein
MKKNEIAILLIVVSVVIMVTYSLVNSLFAQASLKPVDVEKAESFSTTIAERDPTVFNKDALNPAVTITIGNQSNQQPFSATNR